MPAGWLEPDEWKRTQDTVPIVCVDVLPVRITAAGLVDRFGLIFRDTPHQGRRWMLVGGRLLRNESMAEAISRQLRETLGDRIRFQVDAAVQPLYVAQYFTHVRDIGKLDPRQHAVTLNFCAEVEGDVEPRGEATAFEWFSPEKFPPSGEFGFGQDRVVKKLLERVNGQKPGVAGAG